MRNTKVRAIADTAVGSALCALLIIISVFVPPLSLIAAAASGIPLMYITCKRGCGSGIAGIVCAALVVFALTGDAVSTLLIVLSYELPSVAFAFAARRGVKFFYAVSVTAVFVLAGLMGQVMLINGGGDGIRNMMSGLTGEMQNTLGEMLSQAGRSDNAQITSALNDIMSQVVDMFMLYLPSFIIIGAVVYAYGICMLGVFFLKRLRVCDITYTRFSMMRAPKSMCVLEVILFVAARVAAVRNGGGMYAGVIENISLITSAAIAVCGLSFVDFTLSKHLRQGYVRAIVYAVVWFGGFMLMPMIINLLIIVGMLDGFANLRRIKRSGGDGIEE